MCCGLTRSGSLLAMKQQGVCCGLYQRGSQGAHAPHVKVIRNCKTAGDLFICSLIILSSCSILPFSCIHLLYSSRPTRPTRSAYPPGTPVYLSPLPPSPFDPQRYARPVISCEAPGTRSSSGNRRGSSSSGSTSCMRAGWGCRPG